MRKNPDYVEAIRRTAYFLWQHDGEPAGRSLHYWLRAEEIHVRHLAYDKWLAEGTPIGRADEHWRDASGEIGDT